MFSQHSHSWRRTRLETGKHQEPGHLSNNNIRCKAVFGRFLERIVGSPKVIQRISLAFCIEKK